MSSSDWLNDHRVFPRIFAGFYLWMMAEVIFWAMGLPLITPAHAGIVTAVTVPAAAFFKFYVDTGNKNG